MFRKKIDFKYKKVLFGSLAILLLTISCQKDDICSASTITTPLIKVNFYDIENDANAAKSVINLSVRAINVEGLLDTLIKRSTTSAIEIPLNTNSSTTEYLFTEYAADSDGEISEQNPPNSDLIRFNYTRNEQYLNRACGYRILYEDVQVQISKPEGDTSENWIEDFTVNDSIIDNETITYISIYH